MSSRYNWICISHNPAIEIDNPEYQDFNQITGAVKNEDRPTGHKQCDLIVGRWSGGLVELMCPGCKYRKYHGSSCQKWIDKDWLVLLLRAWEFNKPKPGGSNSNYAGIAIPSHLMQCWHPDRLNKIAVFIEPDWSF